MKKKQRLFVSCVTVLLFGSASLYATDYKKVVEVPDASKILEKDKLAPPKVWKMPKGCISNDPKVIAIGEFIFHNLNGKKAKGTPPEGLSKKQMKPGKTYKPGDKIPPKQYGNCVACHNIEGAVGVGNTVLVFPNVYNWFASFVLKDQKLKELLLKAQKDMEDLLNSLNE